MSLLTETIKEIKYNGYTVEDVVAVIDCRCQEQTSWAEFAKVAQDFNYNSGYGMEEVNTSLMVVGKDWWLERQSYDGSEWWQFKQMPRFADFTKIDKIVVEEDW